MKSSRRIPFPVWIAQWALIAAVAMAVAMAHAQPPTRVVGTVTAISGNSITVKTDSGAESQFSVPSTASIRRIAPGVTSLEHAQTIQIGDLAVGDRLLVKLDSNAQGATPQAEMIVAVKKQDVILAQERQSQAWQHGVAGLVKSVDAASGAIVISTRSGATAKTVTVRTAKSTEFKRYAASSIRYDQARPAPIDRIQPGDQLRARGTKNSDGTEFEAEEVVSGTFRNVSGKISALNAESSTLVVKDLNTKKQVSIHISKDTQMHRLPEDLAQMLAARLKGGSSAPQSGQGGWPGAGRELSGNGRQQEEGDPQQLLNRAPRIQFSDLKKGDAVMLVTTPGATDVNGITLLTGVEPLLESSEASQNLLANWSMNTSAGESTDASQ